MYDQEKIANRCKSDEEFLIAARYWTGRLGFQIGEQLIAISLTDGQPGLCEDVVDFGMHEGDILIVGAKEGWDPLLSSPPPRLSTSLIGFVASGAFQLHGEMKFAAQYYPAVERFVEILRGNVEEDPIPQEAKANGAHYAPTGRYISLTILDDGYRIYYEEAGNGIPLLLQHTAGAHGSQYRHLFEHKEITDRFRLIAYDLPYHGKSIPPSGKEWWKQQYRLTGEFVRSVPVALSHALGLEQPVFMGCSVGGLLALDLAYHCPDEFRAVISLEGALKVPAFDKELIELQYHPQVSNHFKARVMNGAMSPTSPEGCRQEVMYIYSAGWPASFVGDLNYYLYEYDLRDKAMDIDTSKVAVYILSGDYDISGTVELGLEAHKAIRGSSFAVMENVGHFPMQENPLRFEQYLLPILNQIYASTEQG